MKVEEIANILIDCFQRGSKVLICGNGGSAAQAQHMAAELMGKFEKERQPLPAIALTTDTSFLTAFANDYGFEHIFMRQVQALGNKGDVLILFSTSLDRNYKFGIKPGKSENLARAWSIAESKGLKVINFPKRGSTTAKIQEYQLKLMHDVVREVEKAFI